MKKVLAITLLLCTTNVIAQVYISPDYEFRHAPKVQEHRYGLTLGYIFDQHNSLSVREVKLYPESGTNSTEQELRYRYTFEHILGGTPFIEPSYFRKIRPINPYQAMQVETGMKFPLTTNMNLIGSVRYKDDLTFKDSRNNNQWRYQLGAEYKINKENSVGISAFHYSTHTEESNSVRISYRYLF